MPTVCHSTPAARTTLPDASLSHATETRARLFRQWLAETRRRVELQKRLVSFRIASDRRVAIETFGIWREEYLRPIEGQVIALRDAREKSAAFSTWKQASKVSQRYSLKIDRYATEYTSL